MVLVRVALVAPVPTVMVMEMQKKQTRPNMTLNNKSTRI